MNISMTTEKLLWWVSIKQETKLLLFDNNIIMYIDIPKDLTKLLKKLVRKYNFKYTFIISRNI